MNNSRARGREHNTRIRSGAPANDCNVNRTEPFNLSLLVVADSFAICDGKLCSDLGYVLQVHAGGDGTCVRDALRHWDVLAPDATTFSHFEEILVKHRVPYVDVNKNRFYGPKSLGTKVVMVLPQTDVFHACVVEAESRLELKYYLASLLNWKQKEKWRQELKGKGAAIEAAENLGFTAEEIRAGPSATDGPTRIVDDNRPSLAERPMLLDADVGLRMGGVRSVVCVLSDTSDSDVEPPAPQRAGSDFTNARVRLDDRNNIFKTQRMVDRNGKFEWRVEILGEEYIWLPKAAHYTRTIAVVLSTLDGILYLYNRKDDELEGIPCHFPTPYAFAPGGWALYLVGGNDRLAWMACVPRGCSIVDVGPYTPSGSRASHHYIVPGERVTQSTRMAFATATSDKEFEKARTIARLAVLQKSDGFSAESAYVEHIVRAAEIEVKNSRYIGVLSGVDNHAFSETESLFSTVGRTLNSSGPVQMYKNNTVASRRPEVVAGRNLDSIAKDVQYFEPKVRPPKLSSGDARPVWRCANCGRMPYGGYNWRKRACPVCRIVPDHVDYNQMSLLAMVGMQPSYVTVVCHLSATEKDAIPKEFGIKEGAEWHYAGRHEASALLNYLLDYGCVAKGRRSNRPKLVGVGFKILPTAFAKDVHNLTLAVGSRICADPPNFAEPGAWHEVIVLFHDGVLDKILPSAQIVPLSPVEWLDGFPGPRRTALESALLEQMANPRFNMHAYKTFVKREFGVNTEPKNPRSICDLEAIAHYQLGRYMRPMTHSFKDFWNYHSSLFYASVCPEKLNAWLTALAPHLTGAPIESDLNLRAYMRSSRDHDMEVMIGELEVHAVPNDVDYVFFMNDYSAMDNSYFTLPSLEGPFDFLLSVYQRMGLPSDSEYAEWFRELAHVKGSMGDDRFDGGIVNASGRDDTAINNAIVNMVISALTFVCFITGKSIPMLISDDFLVLETARIAIVGDDYFAGLPVRARALEYLQFHSDFAKQFGYTCKLTLTNNLSCGNFLAMRPYPVAVKRHDQWTIKWRWGKILGRCLYKLGWQFRPRQNGLAHARGVAWANLVSMPWLPILRAVCYVTMMHTHDVKMTLPDEMWKYHLPSARMDVAPCINTYMALFDQYGLTKAMIDELEDYIVSSVSGLPCILSHPYLDIVFETDADLM